MRDYEPSFTAAFVALARSLGAALPEDAQLCRDPLGAKFATPALAQLASAAIHRPRAMSTRALIRTPILSHFVAYMQVRTRAIDDAVTRFVNEGGAQILILGAGFDCRAARLSEALAHAHVFEVDHPATQKKKQTVIAEAHAKSADVTYVPWHFEREAMSELPASLALHRHDKTKPTLTIWEGVTMYLSEDAIEASVAAIRALSAPRSVLAFTYFDRLRFENPRPVVRVMQRIIAARGEPQRFGFRPTDLPAWLEARGFDLESDRDAHELAVTMLPPDWARRVRDASSHIAIAVAR